jgi:predicted nucleotidyltransferase
VHTLAQLLDRLVESGIDFVLIGGYAAVLHGSSQVTQDLDICAVLTEENVGRLRDALRDLDPRHRMTAEKVSFLDQPPPGTSMRNLYLRTRIGVVDILTEVTGVGDYARLREKAQRVMFGGREVQLISLDDLIAAKEALARGKDLVTAKELRVIALRSNNPPKIV